MWPYSSILKYCWFWGDIILATDMILILMGHHTSILKRYWFSYGLIPAYQSIIIIIFCFSSYYWFIFLHMWSYVTLQELWCHVIYQLFKYTCALLMKFPVLTCLKIFVSNTLFTSSLKFLIYLLFFVFDLKYNRLYILKKISRL